MSAGIRSTNANESMQTFSTNSESGQSNTSNNEALNSQQLTGETWLNKCIGDWLQGRQGRGTFNAHPTGSVTDWIDKDIQKANINKTPEQLENARCSLDNPLWKNNASKVIETATKDCQRQLNNVQNDFIYHLNDFMRARKERKNINDSCDWVDATGKKDWGNGRDLQFTVAYDDKVSGEYINGINFTDCAKKANNKGKRFFMHTGGVGGCYIPETPPTSTPASFTGTQSYGWNLYEKQCVFSDPLNCKKDEDCPTFAGTMKCVAPKFPETNKSVIEANCDTLNKIGGNFTFIQDSETCLPGFCKTQLNNINGFTRSDKKWDKKVAKVQYSLPTNDMSQQRALKICSDRCNNTKSNCVGFEVQQSINKDDNTEKYSCFLYNHDKAKCLREDGGEEFKKGEQRSGIPYIRRCLYHDKKLCEDNNGSFIRNSANSGDSICSFNKNWNIAEMGGVCQSVDENTCQKLNRRRQDMGPGRLSWNNLDLETLRDNFKTPSPSPSTSPSPSPSPSISILPQGCKKFGIFEGNQICQCEDKNPEECKNISIKCETKLNDKGEKMCLCEGARDFQKCNEITLCRNMGPMTANNIRTQIKGVTQLAVADRFYGDVKKENCNSNQEDVNLRWYSTRSTSPGNDVAGKNLTPSQKPKPKAPNPKAPEQKPKPPPKAGTCKCKYGSKLLRDVRPTREDIVVCLQAPDNPWFDDGLRRESECEMQSTEEDCINLRKYADTNQYVLAGYAKEGGMCKWIPK